MHPHCCATITTFISRTFFILPNWNNNSSFSASTPVLTLATPLLLSFSINLTALGTFYKWNHTIFVPLWLNYFTQHNVFSGHSCCSMHQNFLPFWRQYAWMYHILFICSSGGGHLSWLHLLIIVNNAAKNMGTEISIQVSALNTVSNLLGCEIAWWYSVLNFLRNHNIIYEISPIPQQCTSLLIFLYPCQHILFFPLFW